MSLILLCLLGWFPTDPPLELHPDGFLMLSFPAEILEDPDISRRLISGLTTSIELETLLRFDGKRQRNMTLVTIRYEVWEEKIIILVSEPLGGAIEARVKGLDALSDWFQRTPIKIAWIENQQNSLTAKTYCRIVPYSSTEAKRTRDWFAQRLQLPRASQRGFTGKNKGQTNGVFDVLMASGINRAAQQRFTWKWTLKGGQR